MRNTILALLLFITCSVAAQEADLEFETKSHDFGTFKEEEGPQTFRFTFKNVSDQPVKVRDVKASCGCTTPAWTKEPVAPGETGFVDAKYNPRNRPGSFNKSLTVMTDGTPPVYRLSIKGKVLKRKPSIAEKYPYENKGIRLKSNYLNMGRTDPDKGWIEKTFDIYNETGETVEFKQPKTTQSHYEVKLNQTTLKDKETGQIQVRYNAKQRNQWGITYEHFNLERANGQKLNLHVIANIEREPQKLSEEEYSKKPRISFNKVSHDFGTIEEGKVVTMDFSFENTGGETLKIYKTKASCGCTAGTPEKTTLAPGKSSSFTVKFNSRGKHPGRQTQSVTIYSNDPVKPTQRIMIRGKVKKRQKK